MSNKVKQVIVVRSDLRMSIGKTAAQVAHASLGAYRWNRSVENSLVDKWIEEGQTKIVLKVDGENELLTRFTRCSSLKLDPYLVIDEGRTELETNTVTCFAVGPLDAKEIDKALGDLKLL